MILLDWNIVSIFDTVDGAKSRVNKVSLPHNAQIIRNYAHSIAKRQELSSCVVMIFETEYQYSEHKRESDHTHEDLLMRFGAEAADILE